MAFVAVVATPFVVVTSFLPKSVDQHEDILWVAGLAVGALALWTRDALRRHSMRRRGVDEDAVRELTVKYPGPPTPVLPPPPGYQPYLPGPAAPAWLLPDHVAPLAIAAGYAGLLCFVILPGPVAFVLGVLALRDLQAHPSRRGKVRAVFGLVMGFLATLVIIAVALLIALGY